MKYTFGQISRHHVVQLTHEMNLHKYDEDLCLHIIDGREAQKEKIKHPQSLRWKMIDLGFQFM